MKTVPNQSESRLRTAPQEEMASHIKKRLGSHLMISLWRTTAPCTKTSCSKHNQFKTTKNPRRRQRLINKNNFSYTNSGKVWTLEVLEVSLGLSVNLSLWTPNRLTFYQWMTSFRHLMILRFRMCSLVNLKWLSGSMMSLDLGRLTMLSSSRILLPNCLLKESVSSVRLSNMLIQTKMVCLIYLNSKQSSTQVVTLTCSAVLSKLMRLNLNLPTSLHLCIVQIRISETTNKSPLRILSSGTHLSILR